MTARRFSVWNPSVAFLMVVGLSAATLSAQEAPQGQKRTLTEQLDRLSRSIFGQDEEEPQPRRSSTGNRQSSSGNRSGMTSSGQQRSGASGQASGQSGGQRSQGGNTQRSQSANGQRTPARTNGSQTRNPSMGSGHAVQHQQIEDVQPPTPSTHAPKPAQQPTLAARPKKPATQSANRPQQAQAPAEARPSPRANTAPRVATSQSRSSRRTAQPDYRPSQDELAEQDERELRPSATEDAVDVESEDEPAAEEDIPAEIETESQTAEGAGADFSSDEPAEAVEERSTGTSTIQPSTRRVTRPATSAASRAAQPSEELFVATNSPAIRVAASGPGRLLVGKAGVYKLTLENTAETAASDVVLTVRVPEWTEVQDAEASAGDAESVAGESDHVYQWTVRTLPGRSREELALRIVAKKSRTLDLDVQWTSAPLSAQVQVEVQEARLELALAGPEEVSFGAKSVYRLTFSNSGSADAENVVVRLLPLGPGEQTVDSHTIGRVPAGGTKVVEVELVARQTGKLVIKVEASGDNGVADNVQQEILVRRANLEVAVAAPKFQYAGAVATYKLTVRNPGNDTAREVKISALLPRGARFVSCTGGGQLEESESTVVWDLKGLDAETETVLTLKCALDTAGRNQLQVAGTAAGELTHAITAATEVEALADLVLNVSDPRGPVPVGEDVTYEVSVKNRGAKKAEGVDVVTFFSPGVEPVSVQGGEHQIGEGKVVFRTLAVIGAGEERVFKIKARAQTSGNHVVRAEVHCQSLDTALAEEETTRFYNEDQQEVGGDVPDFQPIEAEHEPAAARQAPAEEVVDEAPVEEAVDEAPTEEAVDAAPAEDAAEGAAREDSDANESVFRPAE